ncbi:MAG: hypothetical protein K8R68_04535 [Bacteroidales bacterium]|nr:hypothetical protein [Bacteroidales bacterium]
MSNTHYYFWILILSIVILSVSCSAERKLAKTFIESKPDISVLILPIDYVFKTNLKVDEIEDKKGMTDWQLDSALMANSVLLKDISDSTFLETFINSMIEEFEKSGIKVYTESYLDSFLFIKTPAYILNIAQLEVEEFYTEHEDKEDLGDFTYYKSIDLNAINFNSWIELTRLNPKEEGRKVFFVSDGIEDIISGYFTENIFTGEVKYKYHISEIDIDIIYKYCKILGKRYAGYTYDYFMNEYITENFPAGTKRRYYMRYNRENKSLDPASRNRFVIMEE